MPCRFYGGAIFKFKIMEKKDKIAEYIKSNQELRLSEMATALNVSKTEAGNLCVALATSSKDFETELNNLPYIKIPQ